MAQDYQIKLEIFEGPLDLLLYLVAKDEVDIKDIQVSHVCEQFLEYLDMMKELNIEMAGEFLVMATTLLRLKAKELLPQEEVSEVLEEGEIVDREQLIQQLLEYKKFKEAANTLKKFENEQIGAYYRPLPEKIEWAQEFEEQSGDVSLFDLLSAFKKIVEQTGKEVSHHVLKEDIKLDDRIENVLAYLEDHPQARFEDLFKGSRNRMMMVVTLMAILELMKMEYILVRQECQFGQIWIYKRKQEENVISETVAEEKETIE